MLYLTIDIAYTLSYITASSCAHNGYAKASVTVPMP